MTIVAADLSSLVITETAYHRRLGLTIIRTRILITFFPKAPKAAPRSN